MSMNNATTTSKAGPCSSWPSTLYSVLRPVPHPIYLDETYKNFNHSRHRHPPGLIWKQTLGQCVYRDLSDEKTVGSVVRQRRRFSRLESLGLSGVILFEIPPDKPPGTTVTLKSIFGNPDDPKESGMNVDELLDCVNAHVIYFPSYACTSFIMGQVMSAFFQQEPRIQPLPAREGFSVDARAFVNSSFTIGESFALRSSESFPSLSLASFGSVAAASSIPQIKVHPADDDNIFRCDNSEYFQLENFASFPILAYDNKASNHDKSKRCSLYMEDGRKDELKAQIRQGSLLTSSSLGKLKEDGPLLCEADSPHFGDFMTSHPSILSLILDDFHQMLSDETSSNNVTDVIEKDEGNTSISTLDSGGPQTPRSASPTSLDIEDENSSDRDLNSMVSVQRRRKPKVLSLDLCNAGFTTKHITSGSNSDIHPALTTSSSVNFFLEFFSEPLTPVTMNTPEMLREQDRTPTHIRTPIGKPTRSATRTKTKSRAGLGKENIAPLTTWSRRG